MDLTILQMRSKVPKMPMTSRTNPTILLHPSSGKMVLHKKFSAHPELLERLLDMYPLPLIEGSIDMREGGTDIQGPMTWEND